MSLLETARDVMRRDQIWEFMIPIEDREPMADISQGMILYVEGLSVSFDGFKALNDLSLYIKHGELRCIIGANGAGKTTLMDVITGKTKPDCGTVHFGRRMDLLKHNEQQIAEAGIGRKFQKPTVFENHSVFHNLELAMVADKGIWGSLLARLNEAEFKKISETIELIGLAEQSEMSAGALSHGQKQWLEIGMLLISDPDLLFLDEPVAGMTAKETEKTAELLNRLAGERSIVVVEHDMEFIRSIARTVTVLHQGSVLAEGSMEEIQNNAKVKEVYLGE